MQKNDLLSRFKWLVFTLGELTAIINCRINLSFPRSFAFSFKMIF